MDCPSPACERGDLVFGFIGLGWIAPALHVSKGFVSEVIVYIGTVSSLWSSGTAVEVHAEGPVSIPIASKR